VHGASNLVAAFLGLDPVAGTNALNALVALGDEGEELLFRGPIRYASFAQVRRRWLRYVASRAGSISARLLARLSDQQRYAEPRLAAFLCAGLPASPALHRALYEQLSEGFTETGYFDFAARYEAWGFAGGRATALWNIVSRDEFQWGKLLGFAFRAACASCARVEADLWTLERLVLHTWQDGGRSVEMANADASTREVSGGLYMSDVEVDVRYAFGMWRRGAVADAVLRDWSEHAHWRVRLAGAAILAALHFQRTLTPIVAWLQRERVQRTRSPLLYALELIGTPVAADALLSFFLEHGEGAGFVARTAWRATDKAAAMRSLNQIAAGGGTEGAEAIVSLSRLGERHTSLLNLADSHQEYYRLNAALALAYLQERNEIPRLAVIQRETDSPLERIGLAAALAMPEHERAAQDLCSALSLPGLNQSESWFVDLFGLHRYLQEAILDGLAAGGESTREALSAWRAEIEPFDPVAAPVTSASVKPPRAAQPVGGPAAGSRPDAAAPVSRKPLKVFISYSHRDEKMRRKLGQHLEPLVEEHAIQIWHDREIDAGADWERTIDQELSSADIVLLLVSAEFLDSPHCRRELVQALEHRASAAATVVPIILRPCKWQRVFNRRDYKVQALPRDDRAVVGPGWPNQDAAFTEVAKELRVLIARRQQRTTP
jgi:hypothetical protein